MNACGMEAVGGKLDQIVAQFAAWVKTLSGEIIKVQDAPALEQLEAQVRHDGQQILWQLFGCLLQEAIDHRQESLRCCPDCGQTRRHQGVRSRRVLCSLGKLTVQGIYWRCLWCGRCDHSTEALVPENLTRLMEQLTCLLGASLASFAKAQLVARRVLQVDLDDNLIRRTCLRRGHQLLHDQAPATPVHAGDLLIGSCDGTMVHTREDRWREVKAFRFEHAGGVHGGAFLESCQRFAPRLAQAAATLQCQHAGRRLFLTDAAEWIGEAAREQLPTFEHLIDFYHAGQHLTPAAEALYGKESKDAGRWSHYWHHRLKQFGATYVADHLAALAGKYAFVPAKQGELLKAARFLWKHAAKMDYPRYVAQELPIGSGPMESFCKQLGHRLKGAGMRWNLAAVTPMAMLVSNWCTLAETSDIFRGCAA